MSVEFDRYARSYDDVLAAAVGSSRRAIDRFAAYKVNETARLLTDAKHDRVLDFGCGVGRSLRYLAAAFPDAQLFGFDPSADCIVEARARQIPATFATRWTEIPAGTMDCVFAANVFHHIAPADRSSELRKCAEVLRDGGSIVIFEHNPYNPATRWVFERCPLDRDASMIRRSDMIDLAHEVGLRVRRTAYTLFVPFTGNFWSAFQHGLGWLPLGAQYYVQLVK